MKNNKVLSIVSLVLSVCAIALWLYTACCNGKINNSTDPVFAVNDSTSARMAYINTDTLMVKYELVAKLIGEIDAKKEVLNRDFNKQQLQFEKDVAYFQEQVNLGSLSEQSAQEIYQKLMARQEELLKLQDDYNTQVAILEQQQTQTLYEKVTEYLSRYNENSKYFDFVYNYSILNSSLLNVNNAYDITEYVVQGLNDEYHADQK